MSTAGKIRGVARIIPGSGVTVTPGHGSGDVRIDVAQVGALLLGLTAEIDDSIEAWPIPLPGAQGPQGETGQQGPLGFDGEEGEPGEFLMGMALHARTHQDGGIDEIDVTGLSGLLADAQIPLHQRVMRLVSLGI